MSFKGNDFKLTSATCKKSGVKIRETGNEYKSDPFQGANPFSIKQTSQEMYVQSVSPISPQQNSKQLLEQLDLNINNYSREELYKLFGLAITVHLTEDIMKEAKKLVLKTHPDKSKLEDKYFVFFSKAYGKLLDIYKFQNKFNEKDNSQQITMSYVPTTDNTEDKEHSQLLSTMINKNPHLKKPERFNEWFNEQFEKNKLEDPLEKGYNDWLKSDEGIVFSPNVSTKAGMMTEIERHKKTVQTMTVYKGVETPFSGGSGAFGTSLMEYNVNNFSSSSLFSGNSGGYTDLRQAYVESVIPVTEEDFQNMPKYKNLNEYKNAREKIDITPLSSTEAIKKLYETNSDADEESAALAFYYAQQAEKAKQNDTRFWAGLKQLT